MQGYLREENPGKYQNVACVRANAQKHLPNYFRGRQLEKMFFLFPVREEAIFTIKNEFYRIHILKWRIIDDGSSTVIS